MAEKKRLEALYNNPVNGNVVMVNVLGGELKQGKRHYRILEESYQIARGEIQTVDLPIHKSKNNYYTTQKAYLEYAINGNAIYLYLHNPHYDHNRYERIALLRDGQWSCGSRYKKQLPGSYKAITALKLFVKEQSSHCKPSRLINMPKKYIANTLEKSNIIKEKSIDHLPAGVIQCLSNLKQFYFHLA